MHALCVPIDRIVNEIQATVSVDNRVNRTIDRWKGKNNTSEFYFVQKYWIFNLDHKQIRLMNEFPDDELSFIYLCMISIVAV